MNGRMAVTADAALRVPRVFGTKPGLWMNHQLKWDLFHAEQEAGEALEWVKPVSGDDLVGTD